MWSTETTWGAYFIYFHNKFNEYNFLKKNKPSVYYLTLYVFLTVFFILMVEFLLIDSFCCNDWQLKIHRKFIPNFCHMNHCNKPFPFSFFKFS